MAEWTSEFGWTKASISSVMTVTLVFMAGLAPLVGYAIDRSGPRVILTGGLVLVGASSAVLAGMECMLAFIIGFAGSARSASAWSPPTRSAARSRAASTSDQGRAVGIATSGSTAGQFVFMPILGLVLAGGGWRLGYEALAGACLVVAIVAWWLLRNAGAATAARGPAEGTEESFVTRVGYLLRRPAFHGLFWSFLLCGYTSTGVVETHLIPFAQFCGIPPAPSALAFGILMGVNTLGMIAAGYLTDRMNRTVLLASIYFFRSLTFLMLPLLIDETAVLWVFAFLFGVFDYATVPPTASLAVVASRQGARRHRHGPDLGRPRHRRGDGRVRRRLHLRCDRRLHLAVVELVRIGAGGGDDRGAGAGADPRRGWSSRDPASSRRRDLHDHRLAGSGGDIEDQALGPAPRGRDRRSADAGSSAPRALATAWMSSGIKAMLRPGSTRTCRASRRRALAGMPIRRRGDRRDNYARSHRPRRCRPRSCDCAAERACPRYMSAEIEREAAIRLLAHEIALLAFALRSASDTRSPTTDAACAANAFEPCRRSSPSASRDSDRSARMRLGVGDQASATSCWRSWRMHGRPPGIVAVRCQ